jgi:formate dehydrogenase iron-sulfur subunit
MHKLRLGKIEDHPFLKNQERLTFARCGVTDPLSTDDYIRHGGYDGLKKALGLSGAAIVADVTESGLRGRGGAGFPAGIKWKTVLDAKAAPKYVCCNADEGDSGTYADRMVMEGDPLMLIEGMTIAGIATGASKGFIYIRSEYPDAIATMKQAVAAAEKAGWLGANIQGTDKSFSLEVRRGAGAYICGEETAMLESLEGKRGMVRPKPPIPALEGLFGQPTIINNVLTFAAVPYILAQGGTAYKNYGMGRSRGTLPFQLAGNIRQGGLVEKAFGVTLRTLIEDFGGGTASGRPIRAVQVGGPLGSYLPASQLDLPMDYEAFAAANAMVGHGGVVVFDDSVDMAAQARFAMEFCAIESCGKCTPCRIGSIRGVEVIDKIVAGENRGANVELLNDLCQTMTDGSLCAMGGLTPLPVQSALKHFPEDFNKTPKLAAAE